MGLEGSCFWHLSDVFLGKVVTLLPRVPRDRAEGEDSETPRICIAPTVRGALIALRNVYYAFRWWYAYRLWVPWRDLDLGEVPDAGETGELWCLKPVEAEYVGLVEALPRAQSKFPMEKEV